MGRRSRHGVGGAGRRVDGLGGHRAGEIVAGLVIVVLIGLPVLLLDLRARLRQRRSG